MVFRSLRPDLGETINKEKAEDEPWGVLSFRGHAEVIQTFIPVLQKWTLRLMEGKWFAEGDISVKQLTLISRLQVPDPTPDLGNVERLSLGYRRWH